MDVKILAIESSCDETSAAVFTGGRVKSNVIVSQTVHEVYGGVVPELASRAHQQHIIPVVKQAIDKAGIRKEDLNAVAFTKGPGLMGSLLVGVSFAKAMAASLSIPVIEVNHLQAHIHALFIDEPVPEFPFLCLTASGGHTQIVKVDDYLKMTILGETMDDAAGEAFDKTAKLLGLPYPGGHLIDQYAQKGNPQRFIFPDTEVSEFNFSFSGIKTAVLYFLRENQAMDPDFIKNNMNDICASLQNKIVEMLIDKLEKAAGKYNISRIGIGGGVSANSGLRNKLLIKATERNWQVYFPIKEYCTDNAAMIAMTAYYRYLEKDFSEYSSSPDARMKY